MKVLKYGGTSVGSPERIKEVAKYINDGVRKLVVLSAMSGTTNILVSISSFLYEGRCDEAKKTIEDFEKVYIQRIEELFASRESVEKVTHEVLAIIGELRLIADRDFFTELEEKIILSKGELISTLLMTRYLEEQKVNVQLLPALEFMRKDKHEQPDMNYIKSHLLPILEKSDAELFITQGYICRNFFGEVDNLERGGSDYSASIIGAAIDSEEVQIWTDIDGMHNNDPRVVEGTKSISHLSYEEAGELAYFGAKILHPACIIPAKEYGIPVRIKNTMEPDSEGTLISDISEKGIIKAVSAKDGVISFKIKSKRTMNSHSFLKKIFDAFDSYETSIDMISTSEVGVCLTIDNEKYASDIANDLEDCAWVDIEKDMSIVCVIGNKDSDIRNEARVVDSLKNIPVKMISYGGSNYNISFLINTKDKKHTLERLRILQ